MKPNQLVEALLGDTQPVIMQDRVIPNGDMVCPHCKESIHEKGLAYRDGQHIHGACGGTVTLPPPSPAELRWLDQFKSQVSSLKNPPANI